MKQIAIIDYGLGNLRSISNAFESVGCQTYLTSDISELESASGLVLPGVGAFPTGMENLRAKKLIEPLRKLANEGKPLLGICLGMQLLFEQGEEFQFTTGLQLIPGKVARLPIVDLTAKLPHVAWNEIYPVGDVSWEGSILESTPVGTDVYFVHSYCAQPTLASNVLAVTSYGGIQFCSAIQHNNICGVQFHPEKSGPVGLGILRTFSKMCNANE